MARNVKCPHLEFVSQLSISELSAQKQVIRVSSMNDYGVISVKIFLFLHNLFTLETVIMYTHTKEVKIKEENTLVVVISISCGCVIMRIWFRSSLFLTFFLHSAVFTFFIKWQSKEVCQGRRIGAALYNVVLGINEVNYFVSCMRDI